MTKKKKVYIVSCTYTKHLESKYDEAQNVYKGKHFIKWLNEKDENVEWYILSGKYGIIKPTKRIEYYDIYFGDREKSVSKKVIRRQIRKYDLRDKMIVWVGCNEDYLKRMKEHKL
jgi:cytoplasmic iron level regulating protein YaaA (DUF328/UPF0246 family)